jgi:hypothetical protein
MAVPPLGEEMAALEAWLDAAEQQLYTRVSQAEGAGDLLAGDLVTLLAGLKEDFAARGFMKRRVQEGMETWKAQRPYASAVFGTVREKNNTVMNFIR